MLDSSYVIDIAREAVWITALVSAPLLLLGLFVGEIIGVIQAATQINEMSLSFIPKLMALAFAVFVFGGWQIGTLVDYFKEIFQIIPTLFI